MTARSMKPLETATVILVVLAALLDPWLPIILASVFLLTLAVREVRRARSERPKDTTRA